MKRKRKLAAELRQAVDCLPERTRRAMLDGIGSNQIIVGAYADNKGGVCPMLAAHRNGGRTNLASFAKAWDRYTGAFEGSRPATKREIRTLRAMLEASLWTETPQQSLGDAVADHRRTQLDRAVREEHAPGRVDVDVDAGDRDRTPELKKRPGWAWRRLFRSYDEFEQTVEAAQRERTPDASPDEQLETERV
jgi:hypothetical protein